MQNNTTIQIYIVICNANLCIMLLFSIKVFHRYVNKMLSESWRFNSRCAAVLREGKFYLTHFQVYFVVNKMFTFHTLFYCEYFRTRVQIIFLAQKCLSISEGLLSYISDGCFYASPFLDICLSMVSAIEGMSSMGNTFFHWPSCTLWSNITSVTSIITYSLNLILFLPPFISKPVVMNDI